MSDSTETICFTCGMPTGQAPGEFPRLNTLSSGQPCPTCRDRLLESLPGIFPGGLTEEAEPVDGAQSQQQESEGFLPPTEWQPSDPDEPA